jgi:DinB family protein
MATRMKVDQWRDALDTSRERIQKTIVSGDAVVRQATAVRMAGAWTLVPAPVNPVLHLAAAHERARQHLARLTAHDPARDVTRPMTDELYARLNDPHPAPLTARRGVLSYTYTPRKVLRRVLDHALDHLNQIDQWLTWRRDGVAPTPTDGWVSSLETMPEDRLPLSQRDLEAWLWRIDQAALVLRTRAAALTSEELDWLPPDGGWPLRRVLHHVARSELLYSASLDEALPSDDPEARYAEACRRFDEAMGAVASRGDDSSIVYAGLYGVLRTPGEAIDDVLTFEGELLAGS